MQISRPTLSKRRRRTFTGWRYSPAAAQPA